MASTQRPPGDGSADQVLYVGREKTDVHTLVGGSIYTFQDGGPVQQVVIVDGSKAHESLVWLGLVVLKLGEQSLGG